jgi:hypothetical protein
LPCRFPRASAEGFAISPGARFVVPPADLERFLVVQRVCIQKHAPELKAAGEITSDEGYKYLAQVCLSKFAQSMIEGDEIDTRTGEVTSRCIQGRVDRFSRNQPKEIILRALPIFAFPLLALNGPTVPLRRRPLSGVDRKARFGAVSTAIDDPLRTYRNRKAINLDETEGLRWAPLRP